METGTGVDFGLLLENSVHVPFRKLRMRRKMKKSEGTESETCC